MPTIEELRVAKEAFSYLGEVFKDIPFGLPTEPTPKGGGAGAGRAFSVNGYGMDQWHKLFTPRQLLAMGTFVKHTRFAKEAMGNCSYSQQWIEAISAYLACGIDKLADYETTLCMWQLSREAVAHTFTRYALPMTWDFTEVNPISGSTGGYDNGLEWIALSIVHCCNATLQSPSPTISCNSAIGFNNSSDFDIILTDPPYYDAIPYSDCMDFFHIWLRRTMKDISPVFSTIFTNALGPKWSSNEQDGELIDDDTRFNGDITKSKTNYEQGMFRAFEAAFKVSKSGGEIVIVFANKQPDAWETLASSVIRAGFVVTNSWPIQTEMRGGVRLFNRASLASSIWLVCRKREETARLGWDNSVLAEMKESIEEHLPRFWDTGIRGPDFIWAATGPALEAYSKYPAVKKADQPDSLMTVSEFLGHVRRMVVDYVVGRILSANGEAAEALDDLTIYYLLHRQSFGMEEAPVGAVILYAQSCNLRDRDLMDRFDILAHGKSTAEVEDEEETETKEDAGEETGTSGSTAKLKRWDNRKHNDLGLDSPSRKAPLIDRVHRIMQQWRTGDVQKVDSYLEETGLRRSAVFPRLLQSLIELARKDEQADEVSLLESIMNHVTAQGMHPQMRLMPNEDNP